MRKVLPPHQVCSVAVWIFCVFCFIMQLLYTEQTTKFLFLTYYNWLQLQIVSTFFQISLIDLNATNLKYPTNYFKKYSSYFNCRHFFSIGNSVLNQDYFVTYWNLATTLWHYGTNFTASNDQSVSNIYWTKFHLCTHINGILLFDESDISQNMGKIC